MRRILPLVLLTSCVAAPERATDAPQRSAPLDFATTNARSSIPYQKFVLDNGLELIVHEDHSDPLVAVYVYYHVGSAREELGRSGFAHLFEHMLFQGSEHVGDDQHFKLVQEAGGTLNGTTNTDRTNYFEVLPANQLELALWLESDRMGFLLPALTQKKLDNQRDVVKNERRQNYENTPYGQADGVIAAALYPPGHPYSWLTIGSQEDLSAASLDDVKSFFERWYGPNNATLAIGGDVRTDEVVALVQKYFGSLPRGPEVAPPRPRPVSLSSSARLVMEDRVKLPQLSFTWPAVPAQADDEPALDFLGSILAANDSSVLTSALSIDEQLASMVRARNESRELAGEFSIQLRPHPGVTLDTLESKTLALLERLAREGVSADHLERVKSRYEAGLVRRQETVGSRTSTLANYNTFLDEPGYLDEDIRRHLAVTPADVQRVLARYLVGQPAVVLSVVPEGKLQLAAANSSKGAGAPSAAVEASAPIERSFPSPLPAIKPRASVAAEFDRTLKPAPGAPITFHAPKVWRTELAGGLSVLGTRYTELPMTTLSLSVPAGRVHETTATLGLSSMTAELLQQGTRELDVRGLTEALDRLGASLDVGAGEDEITLSLTCLDKHLDAALELFADVLLRPRFAAEDFERIRKDRLVALEARKDQIRAVAGDAYRRLLWGDTVQGLPSVGTKSTIEALRLEDLVEFWRSHGIPNGARLVYVGGGDARRVEQLFAPITREWRGAAALAQPTPPAPRPIETTRVYLVDKPGAAQSEIRIGNVSLASTDPDYYPLTILNYSLGGAFSSRVNLNLREDKGYTYGARTGLDGGRSPGAFTASAAVKTDVTKESVVEFMKELRAIREGVTEKELAFAKDAISQSAAREYESTRALGGMLEAIAKFGWSDDFAEQRLQQLASMTLAEQQRLAATHVRPDSMVVLVVGDKQKIAAGLAELGLGDPIELDESGAPLR